MLRQKKHLILLRQCRTEEGTCMLLAVSVFLVQEEWNQCSYLTWPLHTELNFGGSILDVRRGGDLKFSGLR